jgi:hypothetical protein
MTPTSRIENGRAPLVAEPLPRQWDYDKPWYHGSPPALKSVRADSAVTQDRDLARVFSHRPTTVSASWSQTGGPFRHNGTKPGFRYRIAEVIGPPDVHSHPRLSMPPGKEWITDRDLRASLVCRTEPDPTVSLSEDELSLLRRLSR